MEASTQQTGHAVVVGGGIGGLLAGLALRRRFERVTVLERDRWPEAPVPRRGAPQGRCLHMLAAGGLAEMESMLPGWTDALMREGATPFDVAAHARVRLRGGWLPRAPVGITMLACSRGLIEQRLRRRAEQLPGLRLCPGHAVRGLLGDAGRVLGVRVRRPAGGELGEVPAALTVVASGGRSALTDWWDALGLPPIERTKIPSRHRYVSRWFEIPPSFDGSWSLLSITPAAEAAGGGLIFQAEGGRWGVVLLIPRDRAAPTTDEEFLAEGTRLADPAFYEALRGARAVSRIVRHEHTDNERLHLERVSAWPEGLVVVGDAACTLDPYYGLGMTACARGVAALAEADPSPTGASQLQRAVVARTEAPWRLATEAEHLDPMTAYHRRRVLELAPRCAALARVLLRRMHLLDPPGVLDGPEVVALARQVAAAEPPSEDPLPGG